MSRTRFAIAALVFSVILGQGAARADMKTMHLGANGYELLRRWTGYKRLPVKIDMDGAQIDAFKYVGADVKKAPPVEKLKDVVLTTDLALAVADAPLVTADEHQAAVAKDVASCEEAVAMLVKRDDITQNQYDAIVCWTCSVGAGAVDGSDVLAMINAGKDDAVPAAMLLWDRDADGKTFLGMQHARRETEAELFALADNVSFEAWPDPDEIADGQAFRNPDVYVPPPPKTIVLEVLHLQDFLDAGAAKETP